MKTNIHSYYIQSLIVSDLCNSYNRRTEESIVPGSMYLETLCVDEDNIPRIYDILTKYTYKIQNIIQNQKINIRSNYNTNNNK